MKVIAGAIGGIMKEVTLEDGACVGDVKAALALSGAYSATVNGESEDDSYELSGGEMVAFAESVKGGAR